MGIINQSRNVKPLPVDTELSHRPITKIAKNRDIWPKCHKTLQNRETLKTVQTILPCLVSRYTHIRAEQGKQARSAQKLRLHHRQGRKFQTVNISDTRHSESKTSPFLL